MKTTRYRGYVLATVTDRDLYYGGIGDSYRVGQVLIFPAGVKPKVGGEMACADNMDAATEYLDGGSSPVAARPDAAKEPVRADGTSLVQILLTLPFVSLHRILSLHSIVHK